MKIPKLVTLVCAGLSLLFALTSQVAAQQTAGRDIYVTTTIPEPTQQAHISSPHSLDG